MEYGFTPENTTIVGYSAGGVIATQLALSQASELEHYAEVSLGVPVFNDKPFARVVSIAGGLMDFNHIDDGDLDNIEMLMIHGTADQMVPFTRGGGMDGYVNRDVKIAPPVGWEIEIGLVGPLNPRIVVPAQTLTFLRNTFLNDEICGPDCIVDELRGNLNFEVLAVVGGPHDLFYNSDLGALNRTYGKIIDRIDGFAGDRNRHGRER
jgi:hypothetical protein